MPGPTELIIIATIIFLFFGGKLMSRFFEGIGQAIKETRKIKKELEIK